MQTNKETGITLVKSLVVKETIQAGDIICNSIKVKTGETKTDETKNNEKIQDYCIFFGEVLSEHVHRLYASKNNFIMVFPHAIRISNIAVVGMNFGEFIGDLIIRIGTQTFCVTAWPQVPELEDVRCQLLQTDITYPSCQPITIEATIPTITDSAFLTVIIYYN